MCHKIIPVWLAIKNSGCGRVINDIHVCQVTSQGVLAFHSFLSLPDKIVLILRVNN